MKVLFRFLFLLFILCACEAADSPPSQDGLVLGAENNHIRVHFEKIEPAEWEGHSGFYLYISAQSLMDEYDAITDFKYTLDSSITDELGNAYKALYSELLNELESDNEHTVIIRQFYSPPVKTNATTLDVTVYAKPIYHQRDIIFSNVKNNTNVQLVNDLLLKQATINQNKLDVQFVDIHDINGLALTLIQENEEIFPVFTSTNFDADSHLLSASYEFATPLPESLTLKLTRLRIQEVIWSFQLKVPANIDQFS